MAQQHSKMKSRKPLLLSLLMALIVFGVSLLIGYQSFRIRMEAWNKEAFIAGNEKRVQLQFLLDDAKALNVMLSLLVEQYGSERFDSIVDRSIDTSWSVKAVELIEGERISHIYPPHRYAAYIGRSSRELYPNAIDTQAADDPEISYEPAPRHYGGVARTLARLPIRRSGRHYGFVSAVINPLSVFTDTTEFPQFRFQLARWDTASKREQFLLPQPQSFDRATAGRMQMPDTGWIIYVLPKTSLVWESRLLTFLLSFLLAGIAGYLSWYILSQPLRLRRLVAEQVARIRQTEGKYEALFQHASDMILVSNRDEQILHANEAALRLLGYDRGQLQGMRLKEVFDTSDREPQALQVDRLVRGEQVVQQRKVLRADGQGLEVESSANLIEQDKIMLILRDLSQARSMERQLLHEMNLSEAVISSLPGLFYIAAASSGRLLRWNRNLEQVLGYSSAELQDSKTTDFVAAEQQDLVLQKRKEALATGKASAEVRILPRDGQERLYYINIMPIDYNGLRCILGIGIDFSEKKLAELELSRRNAEIRERNKELSCLYQVSSIANNAALSHDAIMQQSVALIPGSYQYPEICCARIDFGGRQFDTPGFRESTWKLEAAIIMHGAYLGRVVVCYREERPMESEGPFLSEERFLLNSIAEIIGNAIEKRLSSEEIIKLNRLYRFTSAINEMILRAQDEQSIYREACQIAVTQGQFRMAWIGTIDLDERKPKPYAVAGHEDGYLSGIRLLPGDSPNGRGPVAMALHTRSLQYSNDIATDPRMAPWREAALARGYRSSIALPVIVDARFVAIYSLYMSEADFFNESEIKLLRDVTDNIAYALDKLRIISLQQQSERELRESEEKFRKLVEETSVGVFIIQEQQFRYVNPRFEAISGYSRQVLLDGFAFEKLVHPEDRERIWQRYLARLGGDGPVRDYSFKALRPDGTVLYIEIMASVIRYEGKAAIIGSIIDITDRVLEEQRISKAVTDAQERERIDIGMELHDNVKQILASTLLNLYLARTSGHDAASAQGHLDKVQEQMRHAINELRRISHQLAPSLDSSQSFEEKVRDLAKSMNAGEQLELRFEFEELGSPISDELQLAFYRILQEQLSNIQKYAKASQVTIAVREQAGMLEMRIRDNGEGFELDNRRKGIGLINIRRRITALNGQMKLHTAPGAGCELRVSVSTLS